MTFPFPSWFIFNVVFIVKRNSKKFTVGYENWIYVVFFCDYILRIHNFPISQIWYFRKDFNLEKTRHVWQYHLNGNFVRTKLYCHWLRQNSQTNKPWKTNNRKFKIRTPKSYRVAGIKGVGFPAIAYYSLALCGAYELYELFFCAAARKIASGERRRCSE